MEKSKIGVYTEECAFLRNNQSNRREDLSPSGLRAFLYPLSLPYQTGKFFRRGWCTLP